MKIAFKIAIFVFLNISLLIKTQTEIKSDVYNNFLNNEYENIIKSTENLAISAINKELKVESIIEHEEDLKFKDEDKSLMKELEEIELKKNIISQKLKQKRSESLKNFQRQELLSRIQDIKSRVQEEINDIRIKLKKRLDEKRSQDELKKQIFKEKIKDIKNEISLSLIKANKNGNINTCINEKSDHYIKDYCKKNITDLINLKKCLDNNTFCEICCENEFGEIHLDGRVECISKCKKKNSSKSKIYKVDLKEEIEKIKKKSILKEIKSDII